MRRFFGFVRLATLELAPGRPRLLEELALELFLRELLLYRLRRGWLRVAIGGDKLICPSACVSCNTRAWTWACFCFWCACNTDARCCIFWCSLTLSLLC